MFSCLRQTSTRTLTGSLRDMAEDGFRESLMAGAALFAPVVEAKRQQVQAALSQAQQNAVMEQRAALLGRELAARADMANQARQFEAQRSDEERRRNTETAAKLFGGISTLTGQIREATALTPADMTTAIQSVLAVNGVDLKQKKGETASDFLARAQEDNPDMDLMSQVQAQLAEVQGIKAASPEVQAMNNQLSLYGMAVRNIRNFDANALDAVAAQPSQARDPDDIASLVDTLPQVAAPQVQPGTPNTPRQGETVAGSPSLASTVLGAGAPAAETFLRTVGDLPSQVSGAIFGEQPVTNNDVAPLKAFAISGGFMDSDQFEDLVNRSATEEGAAKLLRSLNQTRIKTQALINAPSQKTATGFDTLVPNFGPRFSQ